LSGDQRTEVCLGIVESWGWLPSGSLDLGAPRSEQRGVEDLREDLGSGLSAPSRKLESRFLCRGFRSMVTATG
jgi:hypothetical protein